MVKIESNGYFNIHGVEGAKREGAIVTEGPDEALREEEGEVEATSSLRGIEM